MGRDFSQKMSAKWRLCVLLLVLGAVALCKADSEPEKATVDSEPEKTTEGGEHVEDVLTRNANEVYNILQNSEAPIQALQNRYKGAVMRAGQGFVVGALAGKIISSLALSIVKTVVFGGAMFGVAVFCGVGADYERLTDVYKTGEVAANRIVRYFDINKDGKYDLQDAKEVWLRVEKVLLSYNLSRSLGGIAGMVVGCLF